MDRTLISAWSKLVSSNAAAGILQLIGFAIAARALDLAVLGIIVLIQAYVRVVDGIFNFQSVHVLTRFLTEANHQGDRETFRGLLKAGLIVDGVTAALATLIAIVVLPLAAPLAGIPDDWQAPAMLFCLVISTRLLGVTEATLRCFEQFWTIGLRGVVGGVLLVLGSIVAWSQAADAETFLYVVLFSEAVANLGFMSWGFLYLNRQGIRGVRHAHAGNAIAASPGFWRLLFDTNVTYGIRLLSQDADILIAGSLIGATAAGLLRAAKNAASILYQLGAPLQQVVSVRIARIGAQARIPEMIRYAAMISFVAGLASLVIALASIFVAEIGLKLLFGPEFVGAANAFIILTFASAVLVAGSSLMPLTIALGQSQFFLRAIIAGTVTFFLVIAVTAEPLGLVGFGLAHLAFNIVWFVTCWFCVLNRPPISPGAI